MGSAGAARRAPPTAGPLRQGTAAARVQGREGHGAPRLGTYHCTVRVQRVARRSRQRRGYVRSQEGVMRCARYGVREGKARVCSTSSSLDDPIDRRARALLIQNSL